MIIKVKQISVEETYSLRIKILRDGAARDYKFVGDQADDTFHVGAFHKHTCIGIATCVKNLNKHFPDIKNQYQLRGMAVDIDFQGKEVGKQIIDFTLQSLKAKQCKLLWCNAREHAVDFYKKMGFQVIGKRFMIPKVGPHFAMWKILI